jgi:beta-glucosidase-like glycosyl hydrolase
MSLSGQTLYQLIISRLNGSDLSSPATVKKIHGLVEKGIGGFIVFGGEMAALQPFIAGLQSRSATPLFIASDVERGVGQQVEGATLFPGQMALAAALSRQKQDSAEYIQKIGAALAQEAIDAGINMPLIPVLDVNADPDNPIICSRAFSDNPATVSWYGSRFIQAVQKQGLISCAKHFPGHGDTDTDSHLSLPVLSKSLKELMETDIHPFQEAVKAGVRSIMIGHLSLPSIDSVPATISKKIITGMLREQLGYEGLVMTDALNMHALDDIADLPARCLNAGIDILLHPADPDQTVGELKQSMQAGDLHESVIERALNRIGKFKACLADIREQDVDYSAHAELADTVSDRSVTCVKTSPGLLPLRDLSIMPFYYTADENRHDLSALRAAFPLVKSLAEADAGDLPDPLIIAVFTSVAAWQGSSGISSGDSARIKDLLRKGGRSIVISFGSPYVLRQFSQAHILVAAYDTTPLAQRSVTRFLKGNIPCSGVLPVRLTPA